MPLNKIFCLEIIPIPIDKEIEPSDNIAKLILDSHQLQEGDILVVAQKIISKQEGRIVDLSTVEPSLLSEGLGSQYQKDTRIIELILSESVRIIRMQKGIIIVETKSGFVCANAGIDESNVQDGYATLLPIDSDNSASLIRNQIKKQINKNVSVIISDTFGRPFRMGQTNCAIGISGLDPILDYEGEKDSFEKTLRVTAIAVADELSGAAELVMGKSLNCPVVIVRNYSYSSEEHKINELLRPDNEDLFR